MRLVKSLHQSYKFTIVFVLHLPTICRYSTFAASRSSSVGAVLLFVLFIDASKYFTPEKTMNVITDEDINRIVDAYEKRKNVEKFAHVASLDEIRKNDYK